jgi:hypothetical protein
LVAPRPRACSASLPAHLHQGQGAAFVVDLAAANGDEAEARVEGHGRVVGGIALDGERPRAGCGVLDEGPANAAALGSRIDEEPADEAVEQADEAVEAPVGDGDPGFRRLEINVADER